MKPVEVSVEVPQQRTEVYDFLDVLAAHEAFTDHFLVDWETSGPRSGVGARARMRVKRPGPADWIDMEVIASERPHASVEESVSAKGRRRTRGTYTFEELPGGGTRVNFELAWLEAPLSERLTAPLTRAVMRRANAKAMERLAALLHDRQKEASS